MFKPNKENKAAAFFLILYCILLALCTMLLVYYGKRGSFLLLNSYHTNWLDNFFIVYTYAGDGILAILLSLFVFFVLKQKKIGITLLVTYAATGIIAQIIKSLVFSPRPLYFFAPKYFPFFIEDIILQGNRSFPSGHTVTAFALAYVLSYYSKNNLLVLLYFIIATVVGFSRIYLSQHFLIDVIVGTLIGVTGAMLCIYWLRNITENRLTFRKTTN